MGHPKNSRKKLGQHFLTDRNILRGMVRLAGLTAHQEILEIGPGKGPLTEFLLAENRSVTAIEIDPELIGGLHKRFGDQPTLKIVLGDAADLDYPDLLRCVGYTPPVTVVGNFPYYVGTHIIRHLLTLTGSFDRICALLQDEVVLRMAAAPGSDEYGFLSVYCQYFAKVTPGFKVKPGAFQPPPKVMSRAVLLELPRQRALPPLGEAVFLRLIEEGFSRRRKMLAGNLRRCGIAPDLLRLAMSDLGIPEKARAESLSVDHFVAMARFLCEHGFRADRDKKKRRPK